MIESYCYDRNYFADFGEWEEAYVAYLKYLQHPDSKEKMKDYCQDPDGLEYYRLDYYEALARFLNQREREFVSQRIISDNEYIYKADNYEGRGVLIRVEPKNEDVFFLQSDQFGFSSPVINGKHIYDKYLALSGDENREKNVARWIWQSRSIGGSFLWPLDEKNRNPQYNIDRGRGHKLDRCDLTLAEIQGCYNEEMRMIGKKGNTLYGEMKQKNKYKNLVRWIKHFRKFDIYVKYFCFDSFVENIDDERICPINLYEPEKKFIGDYNNIKIYEMDGENANTDWNKICYMLNGLCSRIVERSNRIEEIISESLSEEEPCTM